MAEGSTEPEAAPERRARVLGFLAWATARLICSTLRIEFRGRDLRDYAVGGAMFVLWHGRTLIPANVTRNRGYWALISLSRDGEIQNCVFRRFGFDTVRGSTGRGGLRALMRLVRILRDGGVLAFTPDGPRGPTHKVQEGTAFMAQHSGKPVVPVGIAASPRKLLKSWDSYMVPVPFGKAVWVTGEPMFLSSDADEAGRAEFSSRLELALNACEKEAEEALGFSYPATYPVVQRD